MRAVPGQLDQRALASRIRTGDRSRREQIAGPERCAVHGRVRQLLRHRPVEAGVRPRDDRAGELDLELDVETPVCGNAQVGERLGILRRGRHEPVFQERKRRDPRRDRGRERLSEEGTERLVLPRLDVARAPVVDQNDSEHVLAEVGGRNGHPERAADADDEPELELDVELSARPEARLRIVGPSRLPARPDDRCSSYDDGARTAVIADWKVAPVRQGADPRRGGRGVRGWWRARATSRSPRSRRRGTGDARSPRRVERPRGRSRPASQYGRARPPTRLPAARNAFRLGWENTASRPLAVRSRIPPRPGSRREARLRRPRRRRIRRLRSQRQHPQRLELLDRLEEAAAEGRVDRARARRSSSRRVWQVERCGSKERRMVDRAHRQGNACILGRAHKEDVRRAAAQEDSPAFR